MKNQNFLLILSLAAALGFSVRQLAAQEQPANVTQLILDSQRALADGKADEAARLAQRAVELDPAHPPAWRQHGLSLLAECKPKEAATALQRAVSMDEKDATAWRGLGLACWQSEQPNEAVRALSAYLRLKPEDAVAWRDQGTWLTRLEKPEQAAAALERAVELKPEDASAWRDLGSQLAKLNKHEPAAAAFEKVTRLKPDDASAWRELGNELAKLEKHEPAAAAFEKVTQLTPDAAIAWRELGNELAKLERHEPAAAALERAAALKPDDASAWRALGAELTRLERQEPALAAYEKVTQLTPDTAAAWREFANALIRLDRNEAAIEPLKRAVSLDPKDADAWRALALLHQRAGHLDEAAQAFRQALAARPNDPATLRDFAWLLWTQNRRDEAVARLEQAIGAGVEARDRVIYQVVARLSEEGAGDQALAFLGRVSPGTSTSVYGLALARGGRLRAAAPLLGHAWQSGERTPEIGLYLAYARAVNAQFTDWDAYLAPLLTAPGQLAPEQADLALETLRLGGTRPETPGLVARLEGRLAHNERFSGRVTDILETGAEASRLRGQTAEALSLFRRVLARDPNRACWIWAVLLAERAEGRTPDAWLDDYTKRTTSPARTAGVKGLRAARQGRADEAIGELRKSLALDENQPPLRQILFDTLLAQGRVPEARAEADWFARRVAAGDTVLRSYLAELLTRLGETEQALQQWQMLHQTSPDVPYYGVETARALFRLGRPDEATEILRQLAGRASDAHVYELLSEIASARARYGEAADWSARGLAATPSLGLRRIHAESLEALATQAPAALADARAYLEQDPGSVPMTLLEGRMLQALDATNEVRQFHSRQLARNPAFVPSLTALRDRATLDGQLGEAVVLAQARAGVLPHNPEARRALANSLAQQDRFHKSLELLRPLARVPLEQAVPLLVYDSVVKPNYPGRNSVDQISRHIKRLAGDGYVFVNAFDQIAASPGSRHVMIVLIDPEPDVIEALDPVLQKWQARVVYAGNAAVPSLTLSGTPVPERLAPALASGRWRLASGGPAGLRRGAVNAEGVLGNPLTHPLMAGGSPETPQAFFARVDGALSQAAAALPPAGERILVYPAGDFGQRSLDTGTNNFALLRGAVARHFTHAVFFDDSGFFLPSDDADPLRIPARNVPASWDEEALATYLGSGHPLTRARLELAKVLYWNGQHEAANAAFKEADKAGADRRDLIFNWGVNADRQGDIPTARERLLAAQSLDPESARIREALDRLDRQQRPQLTAFLSGWKDNEDRDHYRYGAYGDYYLSERLRLGLLADRDRWSTDGLGSESGTRYGLRGLAYLAPEIWLYGSLWQLEMDNLKDHWGGDIALRLPNPWLSGWVALTASREEIETVEALRKNIDATTYAARTYTRLYDVFDLFADVSEITRSDGNNTAMLDGRLLYRLQEWPYVGVGWRFRLADSDRDPPEYWAPEQLQQHQAHISVRGAWKKLSYAASADAGYASERDTNWRFVWGARGQVNYFLTERVSLSSELGYYESPDYNRWHGHIGVTGRF